MSGGMQAALLPDGRRLHLHHGPIDLIVEAFGPGAEVAQAHRQAVAAFDGLLEEIVADLELLRAPAGESSRSPKGRVVRRMISAVWPHRAVFVTPMAAVAGAVADEILATLVAGRDLRRAYVNNGGDIALYMRPGERFDTGIVGRQESPALDGIAAIDAAMPVRGIATSGRGGRSLSFGIADAVTVFAADAASADVAATLIANAVDVDSSAIERRPACDIDDMTDLGDRMVTVAVGPLGSEEIAAALASGVAAAQTMRAAGQIHAAVLMLAGRTQMLGANGLLAPPRAA